MKNPGLIFVLAESILWTLAYKVSNGTGELSYEAWTQPGTYHGGPGCSHNPSNTCESIYKSSLVDAWSDVQEVSLCKYYAYKHISFDTSFMLSIMGKCDTGFDFYITLII